MPILRKCLLLLLSLFYFSTILIHIFRIMVVNIECLFSSETELRVRLNEAPPLSLTGGRGFEACDLWDEAGVMAGSQRANDGPGHVTVLLSVLQVFTGISRRKSPVSTRCLKARSPPPWTGETEELICVQTCHSHPQMLAKRQTPSVIFCGL